jgi:dynein heavy chain 1, cytosolic
VPGLFEGDELTALLSGCREAAARESTSTSSSSSSSSSNASADELYRRFTKRVQRGLHVVLTMNPASSEFSDRCATSPALFNRCVVDWFGTWSQRALAQVGAEFTVHLDLGGSEEQYEPPVGSGTLLAAVEGVLSDNSGDTAAGGGDEMLTLRHAVVAALVAVHASVKAATERNAAKSSGSSSSSGRSSSRHFVSPRDYLDLIASFVKVTSEKRGQLEEQQLHINVGLAKLAETQVRCISLPSTTLITSELAAMSLIYATWASYCLLLQ